MSTKASAVRPLLPAPPAASGIMPELAEFARLHGRLPRLGDERAPWTYRGWLLPYVIALHSRVLAVADRWGYHLRTLEAGKLLDESIPQIAFGPPDPKVFTLLHDWSRLIGWDCGGWSDFRTLVEWLCWGVALADEQPRLSDAVNENLYRQVNLTPLLERPYDYLGEHVAASKAKGWNPTGFYPTPQPVVECLVRITLHDAKPEGRDPRTWSIADPCGGSGRMLLHASNVSLQLAGQDIDPLAVALCKLNGVLYAPWLSFPLPASILGTAGDGLPGTHRVPESSEDLQIRRNASEQGLLFDLEPQHGGIPSTRPNQS